MPWHETESGLKYRAPSPAEAAAMRRKHLELVEGLRLYEQYKASVATSQPPHELSQQILSQVLGIRQDMARFADSIKATDAVSPPEQKPGRPRGYWAKAVKQLHDQLKESGTLHLFDERIGSPSKILELMHPLELCTIEERDDRHVQKYVGNALKEYKNDVSERMLPRAELHQDRSTRGNISELAQNGMVEDRNRNGKAWDLS